MSALSLSRRKSPSALVHTLQNTLNLTLTHASPVAALSLRVLPHLAKLAAYILIILNVRSLPFGWHIKLFWPVAKLRWLAWCARLRTLSLSSATREAAACKFLDDLSPVGQNPLDKTIVTKAWAGLDDCDYNWHLSNSSYPKILDLARMKSALTMFPYYVRTGGWIALAGTHFNFLREIPMFSRYEVRTQMVGWDSKWFYIVHRFVTHRKPSAGSDADKTPSAQVATSTATTISEKGVLLNAASAAPIPAIHTPSTPLTGLTPSPSSTNLQAALLRPSIAPSTSNHANMVAAAAAKAAVAPEPDGATIHCVSVNVMVFKCGRITVPPALVLAGEGLGATPAQGTAARERALALGLGGMRELYRGAWRAVPEGGGERWWEEATRGLEVRVDRRVRKVMGVREGLEGALEVKGL